MVVDVMKETGFPIADCLVCDATAAGLRECMRRSLNTIVTLADEYKSVLIPLKIGSQVQNSTTKTTMMTTTIRTAATAETTTTTTTSTTKITTKTIIKNNNNSKNRKQQQQQHTIKNQQ